jgi:carbon monoxide dehydrogenase subunit G
MLHFEGDTELSKAPADLWKKLNDASFLVQCIPGVESTSKADATAATCIIRPGLSFVRGTLEINLRIVEAVPGQSLRVLMHAKGIGSSNDVETVLKFAPHQGGLRIHWTADVTNLSGLVRAVPQGLLKGAGQKVINDVWASIQNKLSK